MKMQKLFMTFYEASLHIILMLCFHHLHLTSRQKYKTNDHIIRLGNEISVCNNASRPPHTIANTAESSGMLHCGRVTWELLWFMPLLPWSREAKMKEGRHTKRIIQIFLSQMLGTEEAFTQKWSFWELYNKGEDPHDTIHAAQSKCAALNTMNSGLQKWNLTCYSQEFPWYFILSSHHTIKRYCQIVKTLKMQL